LAKEGSIKFFSDALRLSKTIKLEEMIADDNVVCAIISYEYINPKGETMNQEVAEIWKIKERKLTFLTIYPDLSALWKFIGR